jgi:hypothetical protein
MKRSFLVIALLFSACVAQGQKPDCALVPGWQQQGTLRAHDPDNLFDYMDGNAEGYILYRFVALKGVTCKSGGDTIVFDVFEMADPEFAYGIFSANKDQKQPVERIGMGGQVLPRRATFAKGKYYVELSANPAKDHTAALRAFVAAIEQGIRGRSTPPDALAWFPKEKLAPGSVRLVPESVLGLRILKRGYIALYDFGKAFLAPEETPEAAAQTIAKLKERIGNTSPAKIGDEAFTATDKYLDGMCVFRKGRYVGGFANLKPGQDATAEAARLAANVK